MPRIFDNIETRLLPALQEAISLSKRADFCIGYFNLRGWKLLAEYVDQWAGGQDCCRVLVGMQRLPHDELRDGLRVLGGDDGIDSQTAIKLKKRLAEEFREQLAIGAPSNSDEAALRRLSAQLRSGKVVVRLFLRHTLHAKLYLIFRNDPISPVLGFLGSSNLTFSGLRGQGELNIDVLDHDSTKKLSEWFQARWEDRYCIDISTELADIIDNSWAGETLFSPYHLYLKIAYHLSEEARHGLSEFRIPKDFGSKLFDFQTAAVKIAAHHLNKRGGVLIGDVVGLGKTLMAVALARIFEDDFGIETLVICPKNLVPMWEGYRDKYRLRARIVSLSQVTNELPNLRRFRLVVLDESQNLRNREGKKYQVIQEYIRENDSKCILLSATPYNKSYLDLSSQLRLIIDEDADIGIRPERLIRSIGEAEFARLHQCSPRSLAAFEKSPYADDWRDLMRLYMVRRTRSFIKENYAQTDKQSGLRYLQFEDGSRSHFPTREPKTVRFKTGTKGDQYTALFSNEVITAIDSLSLPRYGLGNYITSNPNVTPTEDRQLQDLSRSGRRLMGFCRTNIFKRLESSGSVFLMSLKRHLLRNYIYIYAINNGLPIPIGTQDADLLDDNDADVEVDDKSIDQSSLSSTEESKLLAEAQRLYQSYNSSFKSRFKWIRSDLFQSSLKKDLESDSATILGVLKKTGEWDSSKDQKLVALRKLVDEDHPKEKILVFSQFADTVRYLESELKSTVQGALAAVTGDTEDPTETIWRFSPVSNEKREKISESDEVRVLLATDLLSEGQNLQDAAIVVNYDMPWAIVRLIQRAGRVDRIGQKAHKIQCYTFLPAEGVESIIRLRARVRQRLNENAEVIGTDESFFEDEQQRAMLDLYNEKAGTLDDADDADVDLASLAYQIWKNATDKDPKLAQLIPELPAVAYSTKSANAKAPEGVLVYLRNDQSADALAYVGKDGKSVTESQFEILKIAECKPDTKPQNRNEKHHELVTTAVSLIGKEKRYIGGQLGRRAGARARTYERLKKYSESIVGTNSESKDLLKAIDDIYQFPLSQNANDSISRQMRSGVSDSELASLVIALREEGRLVRPRSENPVDELQIICSLGLFNS